MQIVSSPKSKLKRGDKQVVKYDNIKELLCMFSPVTSDTELLENSEHIFLFFYTKSASRLSQQRIFLNLIILTRERETDKHQSTGQLWWCSSLALFFVLLLNTYCSEEDDSKDEGQALNAKVFLFFNTLQKGL